MRARIDAMLGDGVDYALEWTSIYTFQCRRMQSFRAGAVLFAGDSAHQVSPFGARGANSGIQDADNLGWKLDLVVRGLAPEDLLDSYTAERVHGADENILASTRATDFLSPKTAASRRFRDAVLALSKEHAFARPLINSGRLSVPVRLRRPAAERTRRARGWTGAHARRRRLPGRAARGGVPARPPSATASRC